MIHPGPELRGRRIERAALIPTVGVAVDPAHMAPDDPAVLALVRARGLYGRYVAPYFTADAATIRP